MFQRLTLFSASLLLGLSGFFAASSSWAADGLIAVQSRHSVQQTADKLEDVLEEKGMKIFQRISHSDGAESAGLELRPTELVIFGNPKVGTPLMQCSQSVAIDLPQKALIWEDANGQVWLGYNDPEYLQERHGIEGCDQVIGKIEKALGAFAKAATE